MSQTAGVSGEFGIAVEGMSDIVVRMAKCCKPIPGDEIVGYISLGKGVTIHRRDCKNARALMKHPERFTNVSWQGLGGMAFRVEIQVEALDRNHLLEDLARTLSDSGVNIITGSVQTLPDGVVRDRFTHRGRRRASARQHPGQHPRHQHGLRRLPGGRQLSSPRRSADPLDCGERSLIALSDTEVAASRHHG